MVIKVGIVSLGCPKNEVDAELLAGFLKQSGYSIVDVAANADVIIVNTCGFINAAKQESIDTILNLARLRKRNAPPYILVAGCLSQRYGRELLQEMDEIDGVMGTNEVASVAQVVDRVLSGERVLAVGAENSFHQDHRVRDRLHYSPTAYVKVAEGCVNCCSYCAIPDIRGPFRSRPVDPIISEVEGLVRTGVKEIIMVAQETTRYGLDLYDEYKLTELLRRSAAVDGLKWLRFLYSYPTSVTEDLIKVIAEDSKICNYIDLPLQHASNAILSRMNRRGSKEDILHLIDKLRASIPNLTLRTTFIVGFPGETEADFQELLEFMGRVKFERAGVFAYSAEEGTPAASMPDQVPEDIKQAREKEAMLLQQEISDANNRLKIGQEVEVLVEGFDEIQGRYYGRTAADAPEIDGQVFFSANRVVAPGELVPVRINQADEYDLTGELVL